MTEPKPTTLLLLLAALACVALYVLGVGLGAQQGPRASGVPVSKEERGRWRERFIHPGPVADEDMKATGCGLVSGTARVALGRPCQVDIAKSGARVRTLRVAPMAGSRVDLKLEPHAGPALPTTVKGLDARRDFDVPEAGSRLLLTCGRPVTGTSECQVTLR